MRPLPAAANFLCQSVTSVAPNEMCLLILQPLFNARPLNLGWPCDGLYSTE